MIPAITTEAVEEPEWMQRVETSEKKERERERVVLTVDERRYIFLLLFFVAIDPAPKFTSWFLTVTVLKLAELILSLRAAADSNPSSVVQSFLRSLQGNQNQSQDPDRPFTTLQDLLSPSSTIPFLESADDKTVDNLLSYLPPTLLLLAQESEDVSLAETDPEIVEAAMLSLDLSQKKNILRKVLHSPQFSQSLASLTVAIRDGGLPSISEALKIPVENGGFMRRGGVPLGGGDAVEAFLRGVRDLVKESDQENQMETD
jgi:26S proteasome regulatory subunit N13